MVPVRRSDKGAKGKSKGKGKNGKNDKNKGKGKGKARTDTQSPLNGHGGGRGKGRGAAQHHPDTQHQASPPPWGQKHTVVVKPNKADALYPWRKAMEVAVRAGSVDSEAAVHIRRILDEKSKAHEETLPISQRIERHEKRLKSATVDFNKKLEVHSALEGELDDLHVRIATAHEAMWEARHRITTLEEELEALRALVPPPPPPAAAEATPATTLAGGAPDSIENILFTAMNGIMKILPEDRLGPIVKAFEAMQAMFTAEVQAAQHAQRERERDQLLREGATPDDDMEDTDGRQDKMQRTAAPAAPVEREADVGPIATQPPSATVSARDYTRDRSPRRPTQGTPSSASAGATGTLGGDAHETNDSEERPSGKGKDGKNTGPVVDIKGQPSNARGGDALT
jgi:hypothetical protein